MPRHEEQATLAYDADELFAVVADVKDYPLFVPWCSGARIHREDQQEIIADLVIGFGLFQESFTSQVTLNRPREVLVRAIEGRWSILQIPGHSHPPLRQRMLTCLSTFSSKVICWITLPTACFTKRQRG